jgi:hypothetical protein
LLLVVKTAEGILQPLSASAINVRRNAAAATAVNTSVKGASSQLAQGARERLRPGPKPKPLHERKYKPIPAIQRERHSYRREKKLAVLMFMTHHRIPVERAETTYRTPSIRETARWFKLKRSTVADWWKAKDDILRQPGGSSRQLNATWKCQWPEMEEELFSEFVKFRLNGRLIRRSWFRIRATQLFQKHYGDQNGKLFVFSMGWFLGFQSRWGISCRAITKQSQKLPQEYEILVINWLRFNRRISAKLHASTSFIINGREILHPQSQFALSNICNLDETPIPYEYLAGRTYDFIGNKTINGKTARSGWDKRQATLILYIFADGISRISPKIIFHGSSSERGTILKIESHQYHPDITVEINETAYNNEILFQQFLSEELIPVFNKTKAHPEHASLLLLDCARFHKTNEILKQLSDNQIYPSLIPPGCTGLLQPLDTAVNKPFKQYLRDFTDQYTFEKEVDNPTKQWTTSERRIMVTHVVANAWKKFCNEKRELVIKSFMDVGVTLPVDGSCDNNIKIKGMDGIIIGDCHSELSVPLVVQEPYRVLAPEGDGVYFEWSMEDYIHTPDGPPVAGIL